MSYGHKEYLSICDRWADLCPEENSISKHYKHVYWGNVHFEWLRFMQFPYNPNDGYTSIKWPYDMLSVATAVELAEWFPEEFVKWRALRRITR